MDHELGDQAAGLDTKKKSIGATERNEEERAAWREKASNLPTDALVFIDETDSNIALTPLYARSPQRGERAGGKVTRNRGKNTTLIAALSLAGMGAAMILEVGRAHIKEYGLRMRVEATFQEQKRRGGITDLARLDRLLFPCHPFQVHQHKPEAPL